MNGGNYAHVHTAWCVRACLQPYRTFFSQKLANALAVFVALGVRFDEKGGGTLPLVLREVADVAGVTHEFAQEILEIGEAQKWVVA
jgi:hypothetical protein